MQRKNILLTFFVFLLLICPSVIPIGSAQQKLESPKLASAPSTEEQNSLIKQGVALHDRGEYDAAIAKYEEVLKVNPTSAIALYELAYSQSAKKDYKQSLETAYKGTQYKSAHLGGFYLLIGNNLDLLGDSKRAIEVYRAGIKLVPNEALLPYNLAVTYNNTGREEDARKSLKLSATLNPNHASTHLLLSTIFFKGNYKTPALLSACRFLVLEPDTPRADAALRIMQNVLQGGVSTGDKPNTINLTLDASGKKDEGDFTGIDLALGLSKAAGLTEENKGKTEMQLLVEQFDTFFAILTEQNDRGKQSKFVWKYYVPYFAEIKRRNFVEPFCYYINRRRGSQESQQWLTANKNRVDEYLIWSKQYQWAKGD